MRRLALIILATGVAACSEEAPPLVGIQTRVFVDRNEARVGDPIGVTIEIESPPGFALEAPDAPAEEHGFATREIEALPPVEHARGLRHRVLWTLRAREVGDHALPRLLLSLVEPDGSVRPLPVGGMPLRVRSVRTELPEREVYFDIQDPPPVERSLAPLFLGGAALTVAALLLALVVRHRRDQAGSAGPDPIALARRALAALDPEALEAEPRPRAGQCQEAVWGFVAGRWGIQGAQSATPSELPDRVDRQLQAVLRQLERERFARDPSSERVAESRKQACHFFRGFAGDVADA